jgi:hypothetical protein
MATVECRYRSPYKEYLLCQLIARRQTQQKPVDGQYHLPECIHSDKGDRKPNLCPVINPIDGIAKVIEVPPQLPHG